MSKDFEQISCEPLSDIPEYPEWAKEEIVQHKNQTVVGHPITNVHVPEEHRPPTLDVDEVLKRTEPDHLWKESVMQQQSTIRRPWEERKLEARALEEAAASAGVERRWTVLPEPSETLEHAVVRYEGLLIAAALNFAHGRLVEAAEMLGMSYQSLAYSINARHPELLEQRSPVYPRSKNKYL